VSRLAVVSNLLTHYRVDCFARLTELLDGRVTFFFLAEDMVHRRYVLSKERNQLPAVWLKGLTWHNPPNDDRHLNNIKPIMKGSYETIVLSAWDEPSYLLLWLWAVLRNKKIVFWIESTANDAYGGPRRELKEMCKRLLLKRAQVCIVPGKRAYEYCGMLGMEKQRMFLAPNCVDREYFVHKSLCLSPLRNQIRAKYEIQGVNILFVGRMVEKHKKVSTLIEAFGKLYQTGLQATLILVGEGPDKTKYEYMVKEHQIRGVHFLGEMNRDQMCEVYAGADILALPSRSEAWGFVLNESMEFGLPLVVSEAVGAGPDLVHPGENGFVFPVGDSVRLAEILRVLVKDESLRIRMGKASKRIIQDFTPDAWAKGVLKAIEAVTLKDV
jgi:glycosyltransferase involved in cell wall biosynthesis